MLLSYVLRKVWFKVNNDEEKEITAKRFAELKGRSDGWGRWIAKKAVDKKLGYPRKEGNYWLATLDEWEKVLKQLNINHRKKRKKRS